MKPCRCCLALIPAGRMSKTGFCDECKTSMNAQMIRSMTVIQEALSKSPQDQNRALDTASSEMFFHCARLLGHRAGRVIE